MTDTMLPLFREPPGASYLQRVVADSSDRIAWLRARALGVTATDAARFSSERATRSTAADKARGGSFGGNAYTDHGTAREPVIAAWVREHHDIEPSTRLFRAVEDARHLATPDGVALRANGRLELAELKTTNKVWRSIPRHYLRQVWWQQHVLGAERTLVCWERHVDFVPVGEPEWRWVDRDQREIDSLVTLAELFLAEVAAHA